MHQYMNALKQLQARDLFRSLLQIDATDTTRVSQNTQDLLLFCSNNYLGLAQHSALKSAATTAIQAWGVGTGASRLVSGNSSLYKRLEERLSLLKGTESALVFSTGYMANIGAIAALAQKGDLILSDRLNHASLIDGCRLSDATFRVYRHKDVEHLQKLLKNRKKSQNTLIVTDGIFSMDGDIAPLPEILHLAKTYDAMVFLDDAHATGVLGSHGGGTADHFKISADPRLVQMGTLSKALGGLGGFIAGSTTLTQYLINKARPFIYTTSLPPSILASALAALELIEKDQTLIKQLWKNRAYLYKKINALGFNTLESETPIIPILVGSSKKALSFSKHLLEKKILVSAIRPPTVPKGSARLRITVTARHTRGHIDDLITQLENIGTLLGVIK